MSARPLRGLVACCLAVLTACGGGSDQAPDSQSVPDGSQLEGAACGFCRPGYLSGVAAAGGPLADAEVRIIDPQGREALGRTDAQGRYEVAVAQLAGPLIVQVTGSAGGEPLQLHAACRGAEIGNRAVNVTPLTELVLAQALGGVPAELLAAGRADRFRLDAQGLRLAEMAVEQIVRPVLDAAGVPSPVDLRVTPFDADGRGLDLALALLQLRRVGGGYRLHHAAMPPEEARSIEPGAAAGVAPLPAPPVGLAPAAAEARAGVAAWLAAWAPLFEGGVADGAQLRSRLSSTFLDGGLAADDFVSRVLQRHDAAEQGGYHLAGAQWGDARLLALEGTDRVRMRVRVQLPPPFAPQAETLLWQREAGQWRLLGDQAVARAEVRHLAVLGPQPLPEAQVRGLPGVGCPVRFETLPQTAVDQRCHRVLGGGEGFAGGIEDFGVPGDGLFGTLSLFRSLADDPLQRRQEHARASSLLALPSRQLQQYLAFRLDARRSHPEAVRALVTGPGLPAGGLALVRPDALPGGAPADDHWTFAGEPGWHAVPLGWCDTAADQAEAAQCRAAWAAVGAGTRYRFTLFDAAGQRLGAVDTELAQAPEPAEVLNAAAAGRMARFTLEARPAQQLLLARVLGAGSAAFGLELPWQAPQTAGSRVLALELDWWHERPADAAAPLERSSRRRHLDAAGQWQAAGPQAEGRYTSWAAARLWSADALGRQYLHFVAPNNPY